MEHRLDMAKIIRDDSHIWRLQFRKSPQGLKNPMYVWINPDKEVFRIFHNGYYADEFRYYAKRIVKNRVMPPHILRCLGEEAYKDSLIRSENPDPVNRAYIQAFLMDVEDKHFKTEKE